MGREHVEMAVKALHDILTEEAAGLAAGAYASTTGGVTEWLARLCLSNATQYIEESAHACSTLR